MKKAVSVHGETIHSFIADFKLLTVSEVLKNNIIKPAN